MQILGWLLLQAIQAARRGDLEDEPIVRESITRLIDLLETRARAASADGDDQAAVQYSAEVVHWASTLYGVDSPRVVEKHHVHKLFEMIRDSEGERRTRLRSVYDDVDAAWAAWRENERSKTIALLEKSLRSCQDLLGPNHLRVAELAFHLGWVRTEMGQYEAAVDDLRRAVTGRRATFGDKGTALAHALSQLGWALAKQSEWDEAEQCYVESRQIFETEVGARSAELADVVNRHSVLSRDRGDLEKSLSQVNEAIEIFREVRGDDHVDTLIAHSNLALVLKDQHEHQRALDLWRRCRRQLEKQKDQFPLQLALIQANMGNLLNHMQRHAEAAQALEQSLEVRTRILGRNHPETLQSTQLLAEAWAASGAAGQLESLTGRIDLDQTKLTSSGHSELTLSKILSASGNSEEAEQLARTALDSLVAQYGPRNRMTQAAENRLAEILKAQARQAVQVGELDRARFKWAEFRSLMQLRYGADYYQLRDLDSLVRHIGRLEQLSPEVRTEVYTSLQVIEQLQEQSDWSEVDPDSIETAANKLTKLLGAEDCKAADAVGSRGILARRRENWLTASQWLQRALEMEQACKGKEHTDYVNLLTHLAHSFWGQNDHRKARRTAREALQILESLDLAHTRWHANALSVLGGASHFLGDAVIAQDAFARAAKIYDRTYGPGSERSIEARRNLADVYLRSLSLDKARQTAQRALQRADLHLGRNHSLSISLLRILGGVAAKHNDLADAERHLRDMIGRQEAAGLPKAHEYRSELVIVLERIADRYHDLGNFSAEEKVRDEVVQTRQALFSDDHWQVVADRLKRARAHLLSQASGPSVQLYRRALVLKSDVRRLERENAFDDAIALQREVAAAIKEVFGTQTTDHASELLTLSRLQRLGGDLEEPNQLLGDALSIYRSLLSSHHPYSLQAQGHLADLRLQQGRFDEALRLREETVNGLTAVMPSTDSRIGAARERWLTSLHRQMTSQIDSRALNDVEATAETIAQVSADHFGQKHWIAQTAAIHRNHWSQLTKLPPKVQRRAVDAQLAIDEAAEKGELTADDISRVTQAADTLRVLFKRETFHCIIAREMLLRRKFEAQELKQIRRIANELTQSAEDVFGAQHFEYADALHWTATVELAMEGQTKLAKSLLVRALQIFRDCFATDTKQYQEAREDLHKLLSRQIHSVDGEATVDEMQQLVSEHLAMLEREFGSSNAVTLRNRAAYASLIRLYARPKEIQRQFVEQLDELQRVDELMSGDLSAAVTLLRKTLEEIRRLTDNDPVLCLDIRRKLAKLLYASGDHVEARAELHTALRDCQLHVGQWVPIAGELYNLLGIIHHGWGDYSRAIPYAEHAVDILRRASGDDSVRFIVAEYNLAQYAADVGELERARRLFAEAFPKAELLRGDYPTLFRRCAILAVELHVAQNDLDGALRLQRIVVDTPASDPQIDARARAELAKLLRATGQHEEADATRREIVELLEKLPTRSDSTLAITLAESAHDKLRQGLDAEAKTLLAESLSEFRAVFLQSDRAAIVISQEVRLALDGWLSLMLAGKISPAEAYAEVLQWKDIAFTNRYNLRRSQVLPELLPKLDRLHQVNSQLAAMKLTEPPSDQRQKYDARIESLEVERRRIQKELADKSPELKRTMDKPSASVSDIQKLLIGHTALVDFWIFRPTERKPEKGAASRPLLVAFVIQKDRPVRLVKIGTATKVFQRIQLWRQRMLDLLPLSDASQGLRRMLWDPLAASLADVKTVLVSPTGELANFAWGALPADDPKKHLIEQLQIVVIPTPRLLPNLLRTVDKKNIDHELLLVGLVDYDAAAGEIGFEEEVTKKERDRAKIAASPQRALRDGAGRSFDSLDYTGPEIQAIEGLFEARDRPNQFVLKLIEEQATEQAFRQAAPRANTIHIASHGFLNFSRLRVGLNADAAKVRQNLGRSYASRVHPGQLCGIALAGANRPSRVPTSSDTVIDDGIITALEVADLDLRRAELVMLSACESGSRSNDRREGVGVGVLSMQRAFEMAGAKRCIAALWPVHDQSTQELMREFYGRYWSEGVSAVEALTQAQRTLIRKYHYNVGQQVITRGPAGKRRVVRRRQDSLHPFFWGAFVLSGDWRPDS